ncbi:MAG: NUDIX hydrolase [Candidatus Andersenbacteria bacterium]
MNQKDIKKVFQGEIFSVWQWEQKLYDGTTAIFERVERPDYAGIIGVLPDKRIIMVMDEQPHRGVELSISGGRLEKGENPIDAAKRELLEETGYAAGHIEPLYSYQSNSKVICTFHIFVGKNCAKISEPKLDAGEKIELRFFTFDEFLALGQNEHLRDMRLRIMLLEAQLDPEKKDKLYTLLYE